MKVQIRNLGVIKDAIIDIKPLTVLIGPNNSGKTWLAYTLSAVLGGYGWDRYVEAYVDKRTEDQYPPLDQAVDQVISQGNATINMVEFSEKYGEIFVNNVAKLAKEWISDYITTSRISFANLEIQLTLEEWLEKLKTQALEYVYTRRLSLGKERGTPLLSVEKEAGKPDLYIYTSSSEAVIEKFPSQAIKETIARGVFGLFREVIFADTPTFPTERTTFITFPLNVKLGSSKLQRILEEDTSDRSQFSKRLIGPIRKFLDMIMTTFATTQKNQEERDQEAKRDVRIAAYIQASQILEQQILEGDIKFSTFDLGISRELLFHPEDNVNIDIEVSSSIVKELAGLVLYLRYLAEPNDWLVIDEPEMNLHPEAQAKLTELLAMLVNAGLRVFITTHSPYVVDHLANLMKAAESTEKEAIRDKFFLKQISSFISKEDVSTYEVNKGNVKPILDADGIIHWQTFSDVSDIVVNIYFGI
jgi:energy-coupling factor transporter ATP-binding protein EcfA2